MSLQLSRRSARSFALVLLLLATRATPSAAQRTPTAPAHGPLRADEQVRGWTILSDHESDDLAVIAVARRYDIDHLELSHHVVMDLNEVRDERKRGLVNRLTDSAHAAGIREVVVWDHALYELTYYPERFRTGPGGTIDLDDPAFWAWLKQDYREMLDRVPAVDGIVLTFIETGARAERQHSRRMTTPQEKLAAVVNAVADVVIGERHLNLYARTFSYTHEEYRAVIGAIDRFHPGVRLLMKETPHDFFLTHPNDFFAGTIARPTVIEFDAAGEFNGQAMIASTWPEYMLGRARDLLRRPHVIGYTARTDRYGGTRMIGHPAEIDLYALARFVRDPRVTADRVTSAFATSHYGAAAAPFVARAFRNAFDIVTSSLYTLGTNVANHSRLDYDAYVSSYARHVSGKWIEPPVAHVRHGVNRDLHYWRDVVNRLAPPSAKEPRGGGAQWNEVPWVRDSGWIQPGEQMDEATLRMVMTEKHWGVARATESLRAIEAGRRVLRPADYAELHTLFERTLLTARLHEAVASAYFGYRVWTRGEAFRTPVVRSAIRDGLRDIVTVSALIRAYPTPPPAGQWEWAKDADQAMKYREWITGGWAKYGGVRFP
ncbi:MAG TPA: hypothetical protein VKA54_02465 [Gemmatimonadaceae bacterium]|nr:hypothetical protein [Gemmatimonadaceae bacterium]